MNETSKPKRTVHQDRVTLRPGAFERVSQWAAQVNEKVKGAKISRSELIDWLINSHADDLSSKELLELEKTYFDELKFAEWALRQIKTAKENGEASESILELLKNTLSSKTQGTVQAQKT